MTKNSGLDLDYEIHMFFFDFELVPSYLDFWDTHIFSCKIQVTFDLTWDLIIVFKKM